MDNEMDFSATLKRQEIILLDGAMGTELDKRGLMSRARNNPDAPDAVLQIYREYARSGCDALTTNTLTMNRIYIETHNIGLSVRDVNEAGAQLARQAVNDEQYLLGDISSTGQLLEPYGTTVTARVCKSLLGEVDHIGLNVSADNKGATTCYERLGF